MPLINKKDGHEVMIIASCFTYVDNIKLGYVEPREYYTKDGIKIVRVIYCRCGSQKDDSGRIYTEKI